MDRRLQLKKSHGLTMGYGYGFMGSWVGWYQPIPIPMDTHTHNPCGLPIPMSFPSQRPDDPQENDHEEWFKFHMRTNSVRVVRTTKTSTGVSDLNSTWTCNGIKTASKVKAVFRHCRTNNEQLVVRPCGIINGRGTMYHHKAISNVLVCTHRPDVCMCSCSSEHLGYDRTTLFPSLCAQASAPHLQLKLQCAAQSSVPMPYVLRRHGHVCGRIPSSYKAQGHRCAMPGEVQYARVP